MVEGQVTITPTEESAILRIRNNRQATPSQVFHVREVLVRWLERAAARQHRHINAPSLLIETQYDTVQRQTFLYALADSFPDTMPDWLRTTPMKRSEGTMLTRDWAPIPYKGEHLI